MLYELVGIVLLTISFHTIAILTTCTRFAPVESPKSKSEPTPSPNPLSGSPSSESQKPLATLSFVVAVLYEASRIGVSSPYLNQCVTPRRAQQQQLILPAIRLRLRPPTPLSHRPHLKILSPFSPASINYGTLNTTQVTTL